jgi:hypothetical protein
MPCRSGIRESIEASKRRNEEQKKYDPWRELWHSLVMRVHKTDAGFGGLTADEKIYYAVSILDGEVHNGGFHQFFWNSSGGMFREAVSGLETLGAYQQLELLLQAKQIALPDVEAPTDLEERRELLRFPESDIQTKALNEIDRAFWKESKTLQARLVRFAEEKGIIKPFIK